MPDALDIGGIQAKLIVDSSQFNEGIDQSEDKLKGLLTSVNTLPPNIQKLIQKEADLTKKIQEQREKITGMDAALDEVKATYAQLQQAVGSYSDADMASHFAKEDAAIQKEEEALDGLAQKLKLVEQQRAEAQAKLSQSAQSSGQKGQFRSTSLVIDSVANSLRGLNPILGESAGNIGNMAERLVFMKQAMDQARNAGASTGVVIGAAVSGGVTLAISAVSMLIQSIQKAEEERKQAYEQALTDMEEYDQQVREIQQSLGVLNDASASTNDMLNAREQIAELFPDMVLGYTEEGGLILKNNEALQEQVNILKEKERYNRLAAIDTSGDVADDFFSLKAKSKLDSANSNSVDFWRFFMTDEQVVKSTDNTISGQQQLETLDPMDAVKYFSAMEQYGEYATIYLQSMIDGYDELNDQQQVVANDMISDAKEAAIAADNETEANEILLDRLKEIKAVLSDEKTYTDRYRVIVEQDATKGFSDEQLSAIDSLGQAIMDDLKAGYQETYDAEIEELEKEYNDLYETRKAAIDSEYQAVEESLNAQQQAYRRLSFNIKSLDEQELENKVDLLKRQIEAEQDAQAKAILAIQQRYYEESRLIIQTANEEIQVYKDKLAALDQADQEAQAAREKRQNEAAIRDLNEQLSKQEAENTREMAEALEEYETERDRLQAIIDNPPSQTARILAERELTELNENWLKEREQLESEHKEKVVKIQRELEEEKLIQQEDAEAAERDKEREHLNSLISDAEANATQKLQILNNTYTVEAEMQEAALNEQAEREKTAYQNRLSNLKTQLDSELAAEKEKAQERLDQAISDENLIAEAKKEIMGKSYDELLAMMDEYKVDAKEKGKDFGKAWLEGLQGELNSKPTYNRPAGPDYIDLDAILDAEENRLGELRGYASGGIAASKQLAWVAEDEPEAIIPMSKMHSFVNGILSGSQEVLNKAYFAMQRFTPAAISGNTYNSSQYDQSRTVHIENVNISRTVDLDLASAQIGALVGGRR